MLFDENDRIDEMNTPESPEEPQTYGQDPGTEPEAPKAPEPVNNSFSRPQPVQPYNEERETWREPTYEAAGSGEGAYTPGRYAYGAQNYQPQPAPEKPKKKKSHGFLKAACLVVVCALVAGLASWAVCDYMLEHNAAESDGRQVVINQASTVANDQTAAPDESGTLTANQIYNLGLKQVVGVNTALNNYNIFGQTTTRAVSGSGFIISEDGYILTNYHVISYAVVYGGDLTVLMEDGTSYPAQIVGYVESNDVAVIKIDAKGLTPVTLGDSDKMLVGEWVCAIGNPLGELEYTATFGNISAQDRVITTTDDISGATTSINMFQIDAAVNHGNSGGPVYNSRGEVIGIVTAKYSDAEEGIESLGFAIPINDAVSIATQLIERGYVTGAGLGIKGTNVEEFYKSYAIEYYNIPSGCYVVEVNEGEAADKAGVQVHDIITAVGGKAVSSIDELKMALRRYAPGDTETLTVYRMNSDLSGQSIELTVTFGELQEEETTNDQQQQQQSQGGFGFDWPFGWNW